MQSKLNLFQSLIGFKINWNNYRCHYTGPNPEFQSLIGFKINWNESIGDAPIENAGFNP
ncbi:unknown protein [Microcystis aeruginosa NIES-843]|uniref:Uncharacterized protein n=1 Tax=Microcystis aeruginosa (strain NIES-843 / IAM M-2473) TaxID=449447 RepID=B0JKX3_MICAN|nr:unknown protein [Microcystis aeruginosa NIES-843]